MCCNTENRVILKVEFVDWIVELYSFVNGKVDQDQSSLEEVNGEQRIFLGQAWCRMGEFSQIHPCSELWTNFVLDKLQYPTPPQKSKTSFWTETSDLID